MYAQKYTKQHYYKYTVRVTSKLIPKWNTGMLVCRNLDRVFLGIIIKNSVKIFTNLKKCKKTKGVWEFKNKSMKFHSE